MANPYTEYLDFDADGYVRVGCMKCNMTVATRRRGRLVHMTHSRRIQMKLADNTYCNLILCEQCVPTITEADFDALQKTQRWGWVREAEWKFTESGKLLDRAAYGFVRRRFDIKDGEPLFPLRVLKKLFEGKNFEGRM